MVSSQSSTAIIYLFDNFKIHILSLTSLTNNYLPTRVYNSKWQLLLSSSQKHANGSFFNISTFLYTKDVDLIPKCYSYSYIRYQLVKQIMYVMISSQVVLIYTCVRYSESEPVFNRDTTPWTLTYDHIVSGDIA